MLTLALTAAPPTELVAVTDWDRIVLPYGALGRVAPSPVVELNRAVAVAMASGPVPALAVVDELVARDRLPSSHVVPTVREELLAGLGRPTPSWNWPPGCVPTSANAQSCWAGRRAWLTSACFSFVSRLC